MIRLIIITGHLVGWVRGHGDGWYLCHTKLYRHGIWSQCCGFENIQKMLLKWKSRLCLMVMICNCSLTVVVLNCKAVG